MKKPLATNVRDAHYLQIIDFLSVFLNIPASAIERDRSLFHDFGVDGNDAIELIQKYAEEFSVSLEHFKIQEYFGLETSSPLDIIIELITKKKFKSTPRLTVEDLITGVKNGQLRPSDYRHASES